MKRYPLLFARLLVIFHCAFAFASNDYVLSTRPPLQGASVFVDGEDAGSTDEHGKGVISGATRPGVHLLRLESAGQSYTREVLFDSQLNALPLFIVGDPDVRRQPSEIDYSIDANVPYAEVSIDGDAPTVTDSAGRATLQVSPQRPHTVEIRKSGFGRHLQTITPVAGGQLKVVLQKDEQTPRVDILLIVLTALLAASVALFLAVLFQRRPSASRSSERGDPTVSGPAIGHFDRYRLISTLGSGGVATIYRALDLVENTLIALKVLDSRWLSDSDMLRKFVAEGEALRAIAQHDTGAAIVKCFRYGREHDSIVGRPFIALELLEGETLQNRLDREPVLEPVTATALAYQIASALVAVHGAGLVHRDLTPDNIFLKKSELTVAGTHHPVPRVVLIDFGIARQELMSRLTLDGSIAGKPHYMSPEQCRGLTVDARGDLYSLGILLYLMAAGRLPFAGRDPFEVMRAQMSDQPPRLGKTVDGGYADLCERLLQKTAAARPQSADAVARELEDILLSIDKTPVNVVSFSTRRLSL